MASVIVTGACGFIGSCLSLRLMKLGHRVIGVDNLSRAGSELNAMELMSPGFTLRRVDLSDLAKTLHTFEAIGKVDAVYHLAAQVAVTTSYQNRVLDFMDNAAASFNVVEAVKRYTPEAYCLYASTNKVYGHIEVCEPVGMSHPLNPYTPYGVSKATGEMYFTEYGRREMGLTTCAFRQSCIYGHHQFGVEDQGWMAWFAIANLLKKPITVYGDGKQVRDLLFIDDLVDLYLEAWKKRLTGVYPVGGGPNNAISLQEGIAMISELLGSEYASVGRGDMRPGDQPYFVADLSWLKTAPVEWTPKVGVREGVGEMIAWARKNLGRIESVMASR